MASVGVLLGAGIGAGAFLVGGSPPIRVLPSFTAPAPAQGTASAPSRCADPNFTTSSHDGGVGYGGYVVSNDMWNPLSVRQTLYACGYHSWYVVSTMTSRGGAVQTYPNSQMTFARRPRLAALSSLASSFSESSTPSGSGDDYEYAYDIWINGYGGRGASELMIWNDNHGQSPGGSLQGTFTNEGRTYDVYVTGTASGGDYVAFVSTSNFTAGTLNLVDFFRAATSEGWIDHGSAARLWQVDYGVEICSTGGRPATFDFTNFDVRPLYD
jgi:hypothetical protein